MEGTNQRGKWQSKKIVIEWKKKKNTIIIREKYTKENMNIIMRKWEMNKQGNKNKLSQKYGKIYIQGNK